jgi:uncharacterized RDD family membrane protein YckC
MVFERVFTITDFDSGPRSGIADFEGRPHLYECEWNEPAGSYASTFRLSPVTPEVLALALEDSAIGERWWIAFQEGLTTEETRPALPEDRPRHDDLQGLIGDRVRIDPANSVRVLGEFRTAAIWDGRGSAPLEVRWERCGELDPSKNNFATFWQRFAATLIDVLILLPVWLVQPWGMWFSKSVALVLTVLCPALIIGYSVCGHGLFGRTVGKWSVGIRVVRVTGERIGWREAWLRSSVDIFLSALGVVGWIVAFVTVADGEYYGLRWVQRVENVAAHEPSWTVWVTKVGALWLWSEVVTMLFNERRRALHDFIAGTVVISERKLPAPAPKHDGAEQAVAADDPAAGTLV